MITWSCHQTFKNGPTRIGQTPLEHCWGKSSQARIQASAFTTKAMKPPYIMERFACIKKERTLKKVSHKKDFEECSCDDVEATDPKLFIYLISLFFSILHQHQRFGFHTYCVVSMQEKVLKNACRTVFLLCRSTYTWVRSWFFQLYNAMHNVLLALYIQ